MPLMFIVIGKSFTAGTDRSNTSLIFEPVRRSIFGVYQCKILFVRWKQRLMSQYIFYIGKQQFLMLLFMVPADFDRLLQFSGDLHFFQKILQYLIHIGAIIIHLLHRRTGHISTVHPKEPIAL